RWCFFFQAEDGIRDRNVTGVQTCALPISTTGIRWFAPPEGWGSLVRHLYNAGSLPQMFVFDLAWGGSLALRGCVARSERLRAVRSEERRVGKGCGREWPRYCPEERGPRLT